MRICLRLVHLNNYLDIIYISLRLVDLNNYLDIMYMQGNILGICLRLVGLNNYFYDVFLTKNKLKKIYENDISDK